MVTFFIHCLFKKSFVVCMSNTTTLKRFIFILFRKLIHQKSFNFRSNNVNNMILTYLKSRRWSFYFYASTKHGNIIMKKIFFHSVFLLYFSYFSFVPFLLQLEKKKILIYHSESKRNIYFWIFFKEKSMKFGSSMRAMTMF